MDTKVCIKCSETKATSLFEKQRNVCRKCRLIQTQTSRDLKRVREVKVDTKSCELCKEVKPSSEYNKFSLSSDGLNKLCKKCSKETRYKKDTSDIAVAQTHITCVKCNVQKACSMFKTTKRSLSGHYNTCNDCWKPSEITKERMKEYDKRYREKHPEKLKEKYKKQGQKLHRKVKDRLRARITSALSSVNYKKANHTIDYLGCSINYFKKWLEHQFVEGMSWDNYDRWQIDHVVPCDSFDITDTVEQMKCFNWKNLRPCWTHENLEKGAKIIPELIETQKRISEEYEKINPLPTQSGNRVEGTE